MKKTNNYFQMQSRISIIFFIILGFAVAQIHCQTFDVEIVEIYDGDSLRLKFTNGFEFDARLQGIDAPENGQQFGANAKAKLEELTDGVSLRAWIIAEDKFNRKLIKLFRADFSEINIEMIEEGYAWIYSARKSEKTKYKNALKIAFTNCVGLWSANDICLSPPDLSTRASNPLAPIPRPCNPGKFRKGKCLEQSP